MKARTSQSHEGKSKPGSALFVTGFFIEENRSDMQGEVKSWGILSARPNWEAWGKSGVDSEWGNYHVGDNPWGVGGGGVGFRTRRIRIRGTSEKSIHVN